MDYEAHIIQSVLPLLRGIASQMVEDDREFADEETLADLARDLKVRPTLFYHLTGPTVAAQYQGAVRETWQFHVRAGTADLGSTTAARKRSRQLAQRVLTALSGVKMAASGSRTTGHLLQLSEITEETSGTVSIVRISFALTVTRFHAAP